MRKKIVANTISQLIGKILGGGTTFLISLLLARTFGVAGFGDFIKVTTYVSFFFLIADFGLNAVYLQKQHAPWALGALISTRVLLSALLLFLSLALAAFLPHGNTQGYTNIVRFGIILFSPAIFFQAMITTTNALFQKHLRYDMATIAIAVGSALSLVLVFLLLKTPAGSVVSGSLALLSGSAATAATAVYFAKRLEKSDKILLSFRHVASLWWPALPLGLTLVFTLVYGHVDSIILTLSRSTAEVGVYGLAYKVFELLLVFPTFFMNAVYPVTEAACGR